MEIFIQNQTLEASPFKMWLLRHLGINFSQEEKPLESIEESVAEEEAVEEKEAAPEENTSVLLKDAIQGISTRAESAIRVLLSRHGMKMSKVTVEEFAIKFSISNLRDVRNCGKTTITEISNLMEKYGYKMY